MSEEILINVTPPETRVAVVENGVLQEIIIERGRQIGLVGNIYKGRVCRVLPGMQAAFVDIGLPRSAFLHLSDLCARDLEQKGSENIEHYLHEGQHIVVQVVKDPLGSKGARLTMEISIPSRFQVYMPYANSIGVSQRIECAAERARLKACMEAFRQEYAASKMPGNLSGGVEVKPQTVIDSSVAGELVETEHQIIGDSSDSREPLPANAEIQGNCSYAEVKAPKVGILGDAGAVADDCRDAGGRAPKVGVLGDAGAVADDCKEAGGRATKVGALGDAGAVAEIERQTAADLSRRRGTLSECGGFIARTAAECVEEPILIADMLFLLKLWESISAKIATAQPMAFIHKDLPLSVRTLRDLYKEGIERVRVDSTETYQRLIEFAEIFVPDIVPVIEHYSGECPLFDIYSVEDEIQKALERRVGLKSGGHLVFDQTESMTTVDVNTGGYVGGRNLEETIFKTNLEAAQTIARQLRLRNLGGIIIIDFIDMNSEEHKKQVLKALERHLEKDRAKTKITEVSALGLVEMTRKRTRESLQHILCEPCKACGGRGVLKTPESMCLEIFREIMREVRQYNVKKLLVLASNEVVEMLLDEEADMLAELEAFLGVRIKFRAESQYNQEQYDVVLL